MNKRVSKQSARKALLAQKQADEARQRFIEAYKKGYAPKDCALAAGSKSKKKESLQAHFRAMLDDPVVSRALADHAAKMQIMTEVTTEKVIRELALVAFSDISHYKPGTAMVELREDAPPSSMRALASVDLSYDGTTGKRTKIKVRLWDKVKALELLGRHLGIFEDTVNVHVAETLEYTDADLIRIVETARRERGLEPKHLNLLPICTEGK